VGRAGGRDAGLVGDVDGAVVGDEGSHDYYWGRGGGAGLVGDVDGAVVGDEGRVLHEPLHRDGDPLHPAVYTGDARQWRVERVVKRRANREMVGVRSRPATEVPRPAKEA
jgi:hypothetical protein